MLNASDRAVPITVPPRCRMPPTSPVSNRRISGPPRPALVTLEDRMDVAARCRADRTTARTAEFIPPASPPLVSTAKLDCPAGSSPLCRG